MLVMHPYVIGVRFIIVALGTDDRFRGFKGVAHGRKIHPGRVLVTVGAGQHISGNWRDFMGYQLELVRFYPGVRLSRSIPHVYHSLIDGIGYHAGIEIDTGVHRDKLVTTGVQWNFRGFILERIKLGAERVTDGSVWPGNFVGTGSRVDDRRVEQVAPPAGAVPERIFRGLVVYQGDGRLIAVESCVPDRGPPGPEDFRRLTGGSVGGIAGVGPDVARLAGDPADMAVDC